jgi:glycosyltransferase involved in cell wall biosynthesis
MRIAYIAPYQGPDLVKHRPIVRNLSLAARVKIGLVSELLQKSSHSLEILSQGEVIERKLKFYPGFREPETLDGNIPIYYSSALPVRFFNGLWSSWSTLRLFKARHRVAPFDIVVIYNLKPPQVACANYAIQRLGLPVILEYEDDAFRGIWGNSGTRLTAKHYLSSAKRLLRSFSGCIAASPYLLSETSASIPKLLLRGVVAEAFLNCNKSGKKNWVVFSGTLEQTQGLEQLIKAWQMLEMPDWELHIAGQGSIMAALQEMAKDNPSIIFHGLLNRDENARLLCMAKLGMNPQDPPRALGTVFAFKIIEYLAAGMHVITTPRGMLEPELEAGISYIKDNSPASIAAGLKKAISDRLYDCTAEQAALQIYGPGTVSRSLDGLFKQVISVRNGKKGAGLANETASLADSDRLNSVRQII